MPAIATRGLSPGAYRAKQKYSTLSRDPPDEIRYVGEQRALDQLMSESFKARRSLVAPTRDIEFFPSRGNENSNYHA